MKILCSDHRHNIGDEQASGIQRPSGGADRTEAESSHGEAGQTTVIMALFLTTFLLGFVAFGIDVESLFQGKRQAQAAADAAAVAYAEEYGNGSAAQLAAATAIVKLNGVNTVPVINSPPVYGNYTTSSTNAFYEVIVSVPVPTFFARVLTNQSTITVKGRSVAGAGLSSPSCVCLEGTTGTDLFLSNNSKYNPASCGTTINSSSSTGSYPSPLSSGPAVFMTGSATLGGQAIGSVATNWDTASNVSNGASISAGTKVVQGIAASCAPPLPPVPSYNPAQCGSDPSPNHQGGSAYTVGPYSGIGITQTGGIICYNSLVIGSNAQQVTLNPGIYVINGGTLHFESGNGTNSNWGGSGVFFYLAGNGNLVVDNGANVSVSAPTSGTYAGDLLFQAPTDTQPVSIQGGSTISMSGSIYAPSANVTLGNGSGTTITDDLVAKTLTMNGGGTFSSSATANFGNLNISTAKLGE